MARSRAPRSPRAAPVRGRTLAELPEPAWPPVLDLRYLGWGTAGPLAHTSDDGEGAEEAHRFDGLEEHSYAPGPPVGGGGFYFGLAQPGAGARRGVRPRSRNRLHLATSDAGLDGGDAAVHPDVDPNVPDDTPGPGEYDTPRWPEGAPLANLRAADSAALGGRARAPCKRDIRSPAGFSFGGGHSRVSAQPWRQQPRAQQLAEAALKNARSRHGGALASLVPGARYSVLHAHPATARPQTAGGPPVAPPGAEPSAQRGAAGLAFVGGSPGGGGRVGGRGGRFGNTGGRSAWSDE